MKHLTRPAVIALGALLLVLTGGVVAYAEWSVGSRSAAITAKAATMPRGETPIADRRGYGIFVSWGASYTGRGTEATGYLVFRHAAGQRPDQVCETSSGATTCRDTAVPDGTWTYTVLPVLGRWIGAASTASEPVVVSTEGRKKSTATSVASTDTREQVPQSRDESAAAADGEPQAQGAPDEQPETAPDERPRTEPTPDEPAVTETPAEPEPSDEPEPTASAEPEPTKSSKPKKP